MKIMIIPNEPNPNMTGRHYGIAKTLIDLGHEVHTIVWDLPHQMDLKSLLKHPITSLVNKQYKYEDIEIHKISRLPFFWPYINGWLFKKQLRTIYHQNNIDIIFTQSYTNETTVPSDLPYVYDLADDYSAPASVYGSIVYKLMFKILGVKRTMAYQSEHACAVTAVSDVLYNYASQFNRNVTKLPNGVEAQLIKKILNADSPIVNPHSLIYVSGFGPWSRPIKLMEAVIRLKKQFPKLTLTLVGEGTEVSAIKSFIALNNADDYISYEGFVHDRLRVLNLIQQHAIGLNISDKNIWRDAAHPMKVIEYCAMGKPVVSTNLDGVVALNLPSIYTFKNESKLGLENALKKALIGDTAINPLLSERILSTYDWKIIGEKLLSIFTTALQPGSRQIVHVTPAYPPKLGGLEKVVSVLASTQYSNGHSVRVLTSNQGFIDGKTDDYFPVMRLKSFVVANTTIIPSLFYQLTRINKQNIVHMHVTQAFTPELTAVVCKIRNIPYIAHIHLDVAPSGAIGFVLETYKIIILKRVLQSAHAVIVFTSDQKRFVTKKYCLQPAKVHIVPNGVEASFFSDKLRTLHAKPHLLFVGRLGYQKNLGQLLHALQGISDKFKTVLVGDGELKDELMDLSKRLKLYNIKFAGRASGTKLEEYYRDADLFVLPSEREGMPLVLLEAMAMGLPIIATNVTGNRDVIVAGKNGLLVPYSDAQAFKNALLDVAFNPKIYAELSSGSKLLSKQYSWDKIAKRFDTIYGSAT